MTGRTRAVALVALALCWSACSAKLPDPESEGAVLYAQRCDGDCHRLYAPGLLKYEMWKIQVERMQALLVRGGLPPLTEAEGAILLDYLKRHSAGAN
jgi:hypothetical protein